MHPLKVFLKSLILSRLLCTASSSVFYDDYGDGHNGHGPSLRHGGKRAHITEAPTQGAHDSVSCYVCDANSCERFDKSKSKDPNIWVQPCIGEEILRCVKYYNPKTKKTLKRGCMTEEERHRYEKLGCIKKNKEMTICICQGKTCNGGQKLGPQWPLHLTVLVLWAQVWANW